MGRFVIKSLIASGFETVTEVSFGLGKVVRVGSEPVDHFLLSFGRCEVNSE